MYGSAARVSDLCNIKKNDLRLFKPYTLVLCGK
jgi:hypothetical protein